MLLLGILGLLLLGVLRLLLGVLRLLLWERRGISGGGRRRESGRERGPTAYWP